ncbi:unnamed protein product [Dovyalis caffra]|uniref:SHSP domain-containing protein n=1 Tax=Dovyalis caffra TaxID=77055 RepID=A0AAV1R9Q5_9ROSI|nr:unnamed protein product [Dovyalis caffra]
MDSTKAMAAQPNDHTYEDYNPTLEWVRDSGFDTLLVYIPGFKKQQLKVQVTSTRKLRMMGERSHGDNKSSHFNIELPIPWYYDATQISAKFEGGILQVKHPKNITSPANPVQENKANVSTETAEPQKPANENPQDQKTGQDQFDQEVPPRTKTDELTSGKVNGVAEKNTSKSDEKSENEGHFVHETAKMHQEEETAVVSGSCKVKLAHHKQVLGGLVAEMKKAIKSTHLAVAAGLLLLVLGIYIQNAIKSNGESEN